MSENGKLEIDRIKSACDELAKVIAAKDQEILRLKNEAGVLKPYELLASGSVYYRPECSDSQSS